MPDINMDSLKHSLLEVFDESDVGYYDVDVILKSATLCWDDTAVQVKGSGFSMVFDLVSYELQDYVGYDL